MSFVPDLESVFGAVVLYMRCMTEAIDGFVLSHEFKVNQRPLTLIVSESTNELKIRGAKLNVIEKRTPNGESIYIFRKGDEQDLRDLANSLPCLL